MELLFSTYFLIFGLLIGSFLNVVILRLPRKLDLVHQRSGCPRCGAQLRWYHNVPVLSFLFLLGRCAFCDTRISWRYPLIEILTGLVSLWLSPDALSFESLGYFLVYFGIACVFICHFFIDLDHHLLPDVLNLYLLGLILPLTVLLHPYGHWIVGGFIGFMGPLLVTWIFYKVRGQVGLGGGDIKLFGILGLLLGPAGIVMNIFLSCFLGSLVGLLLIATGKLTKDKPMAFGPFILITGAFQIYFPKQAMFLLGWFL
jgi:prepilin signal peptidase PulO-like enzyme (type II secretory pathway)